MRGASALLLACWLGGAALAQPTLKPSSAPLPPAEPASPTLPTGRPADTAATPPGERTATPAPALRARVTDTTGTLDRAAVARLEATLAGLERRTGSQLAVLVVGSTGGEAIETYALRAFEQAKLGRAGLDDGLLLVVARDDRAVRIEVGYGLEGAVPDVVAYRVIQEYLVPRFRAGDFAGGLEAAVGALAKLVEGEALPAPMRRHASPAADGLGLLPVLVIAFFLATMVRGLFAGASAGVRGTFTGGIVGGATKLLLGASWWLAGLAALGGFVFGLARPAPMRVARGGWIGMPGAGGWGGMGGGGMGGGGWSGGGGSAGGGGASGSW